MTDKKVIVIGLDGATWDLMRPWAEKGILPTFKKLMENGVYGNLESTIPPVTIPAWISFATGKNPGKLGCYDFLMPRKSLNNLKPITTKDIHGKTFYEILDENGKKCILVNLPGSYPPRIKETVITSLLTQGDDFIFPPDLVEVIPEFKKYRIIADGSLNINGRIVDGINIDYINDIRKLEKNKFECAKKLFEKDWDFFFLLFSATDWIQHHIYDKLISGTMDDNSEVVKAYKEMDEYIGWFIDNCPHNTNILFMSDHGFKVYKKTFFINGWLMKEGYLKLEKRLKRRTPRNLGEREMNKIKSGKMNIHLPVFLLNYLELFRWLLPFYIKLKSVLPIEVQTRAWDSFQPKPSETIASAIIRLSGTNFGEIYIHDKKRFVDGNVEIDDYENIRTEIINKLKPLKDSETGEKVLKNIWKKEDIYFGSQLDMAPDIIFMLRDEYQVNTDFITRCVIDEGAGHSHALQGIFLAYGPDIKKDIEIQGAKIYDLASTILHILGTPLPEDIDGRVLKDIFKEDSELDKREIEYQEIDEKEMLKEKIKDLKKSRKIQR